MTSTAVQEVLAELDSHRERFEAFCRSLTAEELGREVPKSTWIVRDFIAHLATIDGPVSQMFRSMHSGEDAGIRNADPATGNTDGGKFQVDNWNDRQVEKRRGLDVEAVLKEAAEARAALRADMLVLTDEDLARTLKFGGDSKRAPSEIPFGAYLRGWCKHDPMHAMDMSRALPERQAELAPWFDDPVIQGYQRQMNG
jgi:hypothetical protein